MHGGRVEWAVAVERTQRRIGHFSGRLLTVGELLSSDGMLMRAIAMQ